MDPFILCFYGSSWNRNNVHLKCCFINVLFQIKLLFHLTFEVLKKTLQTSSSINNRAGSRAPTGAEDRPSFDPHPRAGGRCGTAVLAGGRTALGASCRRVTPTTRRLGGGGRLRGPEGSRRAHPQRRRRRRRRATASERSQIRGHKRLPGEELQACPAGKKPPSAARTCRSHRISHPRSSPSCR